MAKRSLRPQLNQIRTWVRQGRTDAWIAHQLDVTVQQIQTFKRENELAPDSEPVEGNTAPVFGDEIDLRAEDDALIAAELEAEAKAKPARKSRAAASADDEDAPEGEGEDGESSAPKRRRGRRGGRGRGSRSRDPLEGTFDHGEEGYGLWLDPAVADSPVYAEHWSGHRQVEVVIEPDRIVIRRAGEPDAGDDDGAEPDAG